MAAWVRRAATLGLLQTVLAAGLVVGAYTVEYRGDLKLVRDPIVFADVGFRFLEKSHASRAIDDRGYPALQEIGYDGQFFYFTAVDPANARHYMDAPGYRLTRIAYPMLARLLAGGDPAAVPYRLVEVNILMLGLGTAALAGWLLRSGRSPWFALLFGFFPGAVISFEHDTSEAMAYALVAVAVLLLDFGPRPRVLWAGLAFALAALTRETSALFPLLYVAARAYEGRRGEAAALAGLALLPLLAWKVAVRLWVGSWGIEPLFTPVAFSGLLSLYPFDPHALGSALVVGVPVLVSIVTGAVCLLRGVRTVHVLLLLASAALMAFLVSGSWVDITGAARIALGLGLAMILALGSIRRTAWFWLAATFWLSATYTWVVTSLWPAAAALLSQ